MANHAESLLPEGKKWKLVWNDEFDKPELDRSKWDFRLDMMHTRHKTWVDDAYSIRDSTLKLNLKREGNDFYSTQLQTGENRMDRAPDNQYDSGGLQWPIASFRAPKFLKKYGFFECRCKLQKQPGWWSAFWLQSPGIGTSPDPAVSGVEVDIMENFVRDGSYAHTLFWGGYGKDMRSNWSGERKLENDLSGWHIFAVDWSPKGYIFYVDGKESWRFSEVVSHTEQFILVSTECIGYRKGKTPAPELEKAVLPDAFEVDFVRVYDEVK